ncbi:MAG: fibronectin type III domain-containing protein [Caldilineaceae bacterium]
MANLSVRAVVSKCLKKSARLSLIEDIFTINDIPSPNSLKSALQFIRAFHCPPAAPTNLRITEVGENSILITWDDNADNEDGFEIVWTGRRDGYIYDDGSKKLRDPNRESFTLNYLYPSFTYCIRVRAFNVGGNSSYSNEDCATVPDAPTPNPNQGFSAVQFFNCHTERRTVHIWRRDVTAGSSWEALGSLPYQGQDNVPCPPTSATPFEVALQEKHRYEIVAVDTGAINCGSNDPAISSCRRFETVLIGNPNGSPTQVGIS